MNCDELVELRFYIIVNWFFFLLPRYGSTKFNHTHTHKRIEKENEILFTVHWFCSNLLVSNQIIQYYIKDPNISILVYVCKYFIYHKNMTRLWFHDANFARPYLFDLYITKIWSGVFFMRNTNYKREKKCSTFIYWVIKCL